MKKSHFKIAYVLLFVSLIFSLFTSCDTQPQKTKMPENFTFSLTFGTYGESSYDSDTGRLVKTANATFPSRYKTTLFLSKEKLTEIYNLINELNIESYPETYDPINNPNSDNKVMSVPSETIILTVRTDSIQKMVSCIELASRFSKGYDNKAQAFLDTCQRIVEIIYETEEWKALPEYEFFYD